MITDPLALHFAAVLARMDAPDITTAEELRLRRLDMLEGIRRVFATEGEVPEWVDALAARVESDYLQTTREAGA